MKKIVIVSALMVNSVFAAEPPKIDPSKVITLTVGDLLSYGDFRAANQKAQDDAEFAQKRASEALGHIGSAISPPPAPEASPTPSLTPDKK